MNDVDEFFTPLARLQGMLDFEAGLARAEAEVGLVSPDAAESIAATCRAELFDLDAIGTEAAEAGNPAIPMVRYLTACVAERDGGAAQYVHWGATSQDAIDTGLMLQCRSALARLETVLDQLADSLAELARRHAATPMPARTLLQQASPTTFGYKCALWLEAVEAPRAALSAAGSDLLALQLGGAAGTRASLAGRGEEVAKTLGRALGLPVPALPWHTNRDRWRELGSRLARLAASLAKIARDIGLLMQTEIGEVREGRAPGRGGSSSLPHKRNPVFATATLTAARQIPGRLADLFHTDGLEQERGVGGWHAEGELISDIFRLTGRATGSAAEMIAGLEVDPARMRVNLEATSGRIFAEALAGALAPHLGPAAAREHVRTLCRRAEETGRDLRRVAGEDEAVSAHLDPSALDTVFNAASQTGEAERLALQALVAYRARRPAKG